MTSITVIQDMTLHRRTTDGQTDFAGKLYTYHDMTVIDQEGRGVGTVDWIWSDEATGRAAFIGIHLRWLRGTAQAIPVDGVVIDREHGAVRVPHLRRHIKHSPRFSIGSGLTEPDEHANWAHYQRARSTSGAPWLVKGQAA